MRIDSSGNVGIGTSPSARLHVSNGSNSETGNFTGLVIGGTDGTNARTASLIKNTSSPYDLIIQSQNNIGTTTGNLIFQNGSTEHLRINSSGDVGIGSTSPQAVLDLGAPTTGRAITWAGATGADRYNSIFSSFSAAALVFSSGFHGSTSADSYISSYTGTQGLAGIRFDSVGANDGSIKFFTNATAVRTAGSAVVPTERMRLNSSGNFSIGTATALSKLHVHGDLTMSNATTAVTASTSTITPPATVAGYLTVSINGTSRKIAYYAT
jgi:hypothetical protein